MTNDTTSIASGLSRRTLLRAGAALGAAGIIGMPHIAKAADTVRFSLEFRIYGGNAPFFYGVEKGFFKDQGIDIQLDGSAGSGEAVRRIAAGTHEFGTADAATVVEFVGRNPNVGLKSTMMVFDNFPAVILSLKRKPLTKMEQLVGAKIGVGASSAATKILPALLKAHNIDPNKINFVNIDVKLRDTMLLKGEVDAVIAFDYTAIFNLMESGVKQEDIVLLYYSENGFAFPGNSLVASKAMMETKPDLTKRLAKAIARCWVEGNKDREGCIAAVTKRERLLDPTVELARLNFVYQKHVLTKNVLANGLGAITQGRLKAGMDILSESLELTPPPTVAQVYDDQFLPPIEDRRFS
ncbi:ABC transporter substrate-binding protein [Aquabacter sp. CN5-332]|uniref:ABC transporter substrate-binding protein n=1 Tax=Aquabacter sp. CN5-332 TaxID=3156608 RepID=UPI0032B390EA